MKKLFQSFKLRLFIAIVLIGIVAVMLLENSIIAAFQNKAFETKTAGVIDDLVAVSGKMAAEKYPLNSSLAFDDTLSTLSSIYGGRIIVANSDFKIIYDSYGCLEDRYFTARNVIKAYKGQISSDISDEYLEVVVPVKNGDSTFGVIYAGVSLKDEMNIKSALESRADTYVLIAILAIIVFAAITTFALSYPFSKISKQIKNFAAFDEGTIEPSGYLETEDIAEAFNELKVRLKILDDSRQEFVSNVSHELKTPITSIKVLADSINGQEDVPNELYREFMQDIVDEIDRENSIITDLLSLVKLDKGVSGLNISEMNVNEMLELIIKRLWPIAELNEVELSFEADKEIYADLDDVKMTLALTNLIENGIKYSNPGGLVRVILDEDHQYFTVTIEDSGIGIAKEEIDHIFERFYRVDKSHSREIGGTGLGLAIARKTVLLHRGSIKVESEVGVGTTFIVRLPITYIKA